MSDRQRSRSRLEVRESAQRDFAAASGPDIYVPETFRSLPELGSNLHHNVILILLLEHGRNLPLPKCVVKGLVDCLRAYAHPRCGQAVVIKLDLQSLILLVRTDVGESGQFPDLLQQYRA